MSYCNDIISSAAVIGREAVTGTDDENSSSAL